MESIPVKRSLGILGQVILVQAGVSEAEQVLCSGGIPIARLIAVGFDTAGDVPAGWSATTNRMKKNRYRILQTRDALYSLLAGLLPSLLLLMVFLALNINVIDCLA